MLVAVLGALTSAYSRSLQPSLPYYVAAALGLGVLQIAAGFTLRSMRPLGFWVMISTTAVNAAASMIGLATGVQEVSGVVLSLMVNGVIAGYIASKRRLFGVKLGDRLG